MSTIGDRNFMKKRKNSRSQAKRESIVNAAKRAFSKHGVQNTSMDKVADLAGVSKRTVYNHFPNKEELVLHVVSNFWHESMAQTEANYQSGAPLADQLTALLEAEIDFISGPKILGLARAAVGYFLYHPEKMQAEAAKLIAQESAIHRWLHAAIDDGRIKPLDVRFAATQVHNLIKGSCYWPQLVGTEPKLDSEQKKRLAREAAAMFLSHYRA